MSNQCLTKSYTTESIVSPYTILKLGSADDLVVKGAAATDAVIGVVEGVAPDGIGERCDVVLVGIAEVRLGGTVTRGGSLVSNASGAGVAGATGNRAIGFVLASGVVGDIVPVLLSPHTV